MTDFKALLRVLSDAGVEYILVGGVAAAAHGATRLTLDVDAVYSRSPENIARLAAALAPHHPYLRGAPLGLPFRFDAPTIQRGLNFTLTSDLGNIDLLGEILGGGTYEMLRESCVALEIFGIRCLALGLERLIAVKRAAGRPKDLDAIAELEAILEERAKR